MHLWMAYEFSRNVLKQPLLKVSFDIHSSSKSHHHRYLIPSKIVSNQTKKKNDSIHRFQTLLKCCDRAAEKKSEVVYCDDTSEWNRKFSADHIGLIKRRSVSFEKKSRLSEERKEKNERIQSEMKFKNTNKFNFIRNIKKSVWIGKKRRIK